MFRVRGFIDGQKKKKLRRKVNMLQCPSSLKQINFKMECFSSLSGKPSLYYKYRGDLLQHSVVTIRITKLNHEIQEQWHLALMLV